MRLELIKELCKNRQISIKNLATNVGISEPTLYRCIRMNQIQAEILEKIAQALNISVSAFFDESVADIHGNVIGNNNVAAIHGSINVANPNAKDIIKEYESKLAEKNDQINLLKDYISLLKKDRMQ